MNLNSVTEWLGQLWGLPGVVLVFLLCVFVCKGLRSMKTFPNQWTWLVMLVAGALLNVLIADPDSNDPLNKVIDSYRLWIGKSAVVGAIAGQIAQTGYTYVLRKMPWFSEDNDQAEDEKDAEAEK